MLWSCDAMQSLVFWQKISIWRINMERVGLVLVMSNIKARAVDIQWDSLDYWEEKTGLREALLPQKRWNFGKVSKRGRQFLFQRITSLKEMEFFKKFQQRGEHFIKEMEFWNSTPRASKVHCSTISMDLGNSSSPEYSKAYCMITLHIEACLTVKRCKTRQHIKKNLPF